MSENIAIICDYKLNPNRIGGMDRFFVAFDDKLKSENYEVKWFFLEVIYFNFYKNLNIFSANNQNVGSFFLEYLQSNNQDIVITHFLPICDSFSKKVKQFGVKKLIAVDHNPRPFEGFAISKIIKNKLKGVLYSQYTDCFIGVADYTKKHILKDFGKFLKKKTTVVYNGIDCEIYKIRTEDNLGKFIVTSHLRPSKGIQDLIIAVSMLPFVIKEKLSIDIFGEGPMEQELKQMVIKNDVQNIFSFKGSSAELNNIFCNYSYMIQPTYMECFSLSILESLASNVPVITTTVGGNLEVVTDKLNGFIFEPSDINKLSEIIEKIINDKIRIETKTNILIEQEFELKTMVENHFKLI